MWGEEFQAVARILGSLLLLLIGIFLTYSTANVFSKRKTEELIRAEESLQKYRLMVESSNDAMFIKDLKSRYILVNKKILELFGGRRA